MSWEKLANAVFRCALEDVKFVGRYVKDCGSARAAADARAFLVLGGKWERVRELWLSMASEAVSAEAERARAALLDGTFAPSEAAQSKASRRRCSGRGRKARSG